jgi:hypothetical protein
MAARAALHTYLRVALDELADPPALAFQCGVDASPKLGTIGNTGVALFLAGAVARGVARRDRKRFADWIDRARTVYDRHLRNEITTVKKVAVWSRRSLSREDKDAFETSLHVGDRRHIGYLPRDRAHLPPAMQVGYVAGLAGFDLEMGGGGPYLTVAIGEAIRHALAAARDARAFVAELDRVIVREELRVMLAERGHAYAPDVEACLWRAASNRKVTHLLGRLASGELVLTFKIGTRWRVFTGPRDEVLATIPDEHFESAVDMINSLPDPPRR